MGTHHTRHQARLRASPAPALFILGLLTLLAACSGSDPEPTTAELLAELEGRELTAAEVAEKEEVAALLCGLDDKVLIHLWTQLEPEQLEFQDFVFLRQCPERNPLYAEATGRFVVNDTDPTPGSSTTTS